MTLCVCGLHINNLVYHKHHKKVAQFILFQGFFILESAVAQRARKSKKVQAKKLVKFFFREIAFLAVLNFFPVSSIVFWPYLKLQKMEFGKKKISG